MYRKTTFTPKVFMYNPLYFISTCLPNNGNDDKATKPTNPFK